MDLTLRSILFLLLFALFQISVSVPAARRAHRHVRDASDGRLPRNVFPYHYNVELKANIYTGAPPFPVDGYAEIFLNCSIGTNTVVLNWKDMTMVGVNIYADPNSPITPPSPILLEWSVDTTAQFLTLNTANPLEPGALYIITVYFSYSLRSDGSGFYYDSYVDDSGVTQYLAATQMESIDARAAFPCFDEPDLKATFNITVVSQPPSVTLSNMEVARTEDRGSGWTAYYFGTSPIMSTYQVAIAVGNFIYAEADWRDVTTYPVRIYARPQMAGNLGFAVKVAAKLQAWLEEETQIPYTLPKMDHIALPGKGGAMENWGLITYGEDYLCVNPDTSGVDGIITVTSVIAHELAHQWYGNLVTMTWWNDIWLNEGFATYYNFYPQVALGWPDREQQQGDDRRGTQQFLDTDARNTSDPVRKSVSTVWQADSAFSGSTYPKGGAILRQLSGILTPSTFKKGLTRYLNKYAYKTATTDDLWAELTAQAAEDGIKNPDGSALDVKYRLDAWIDQMGYPLLEVNRNADTTVTINSKRFFNPIGQSPDVASPYNYTWNIPITFLTASTTDLDALPDAWIELGQTSLTVSAPASAWFLVNTRQSAFYRVYYDSVLHHDIVNQLLTDYTKIPSENRASFIDDSFTVARTLGQPETLALETTRYLGQETEYNPWSVAFKHIRYTDRIYRNFIWHSLYRTYVTNLMVPVYNQTGWEYVEFESPQTSKLRRDMVINTCFYGYEDCRTKAKEYYEFYKLNPDVISINANNLPTALCLGVSQGTATDWSMVFNQYQKRKTSPIREERYAYLFGLACSTDTTWLDRLLSYIIRGELIETRDQNQALYYLTLNTVGAPIVWSYLDNSWNAVPSTINKLTALRNIAIVAYNAEGAAKFDNFVAKYPPSTQNELEQYRQIDLIIKQNIEWITANGDEVASWLDAQVSRDLRADLKLEAPLPISPMALNEWPSADELY